MPGPQRVSPFRIGLPGLPPAFDQLAAGFIYGLACDQQSIRLPLVAAALAARAGRGGMAVLVTSVDPAVQARKLALSGLDVGEMIGAGELKFFCHTMETGRDLFVTGTQRRHEPCYLEAIKRVHGGDLGKIVSARCYWNQGGLWMHDRQEKWSDMEWQLRNWLYFTWLSGDHIVEQHVHNLDAINWFLNATPLKASGLGGRQVRTAPAYGHIFDHFAVEYEYPDGVIVNSQCRQIPNCSDRVEEVVVGTNGTSFTASGQARIEGSKAWKYKGSDESPYVLEHRDMIAGIVAGVITCLGFRSLEMRAAAKNDIHVNL